MRRVAEHELQVLLGERKARMEGVVNRLVVNHFVWREKVPRLAK